MWHGSGRGGAARVAAGAVRSRRTTRPSRSVRARCWLRGTRALLTGFGWRGGRASLTGWARSAQCVSVEADPNKGLPFGVDRNLVAPRVLRKTCESSEKRDGAV